MDKKFLDQKDPQNFPEEECQRPCWKNPNETCAEPSCNCRHPPECQEIQKNRKEAAVMARSVLYLHGEKSEPSNKRSKKEDGRIGQCSLATVRNVKKMGGASRDI